MKPLYRRIPFWMSLVLVVISCRKEAEEPAPNLANCRIVKETFKHNVKSIHADPTPETITVEGKQVNIYLFTTVKYMYDQQGRIIREETGPKDNIFWTTYAYSPTTITQVRRIIRDPDGIIIQTIAIPLNERGLDARIQYDAEGYPNDSINTKGQSLGKRVGGNLVRTKDFFYDMTIEGQLEYDLTRANLPNKYPFKGKENPNLITRQIYSSKDALLYRRGELYRVNYYYEFDRYGRVRRCIQVFRNDYNSGWPYKPDGVEIGVTDFEYECP